MNRAVIRVSLTPDMTPTFPPGKISNVIVVDILRATTSMCVAFGSGARAVIPVPGGGEELRLWMEELRFTNKGSVVAGESDGIKLPYADFGNSPLEFQNPAVKDKVIIFSTTNGTRAILKAGEIGHTYVSSFVNFTAIKSMLACEQKDVTILCAGWKGRFSLEDALYAGKLAESLARDHGFSLSGDEALASVSLWQRAKDDLLDFAAKSSHYRRLKDLESPEGLRYCFEPEELGVLPKLAGDRLIDIGR